MTRPQKLTLAFFSLPFFISAAFYFGGWWLGGPALVVLGLSWLGTISLMTREGK